MFSVYLRTKFYVHGFDGSLIITIETETKEMYNLYNYQFSQDILKHIILGHSAHGINAASSFQDGLG
jgi:hypothetical protein